MGEKNIVITGATGFIGSFLIEEALRRGYRVVAWGREESQKGSLPSSVELIRPGFSDYNKMLDALRYLKTNYGKIDAFIHNAGLTKTLKSSEFIEVNANHTFRLTEALRRSSVEPELFVLMSSLAAAGPGDPVSLKPISPHDEPKPNTLYGRSKLMAEQIVRNSGLNYTIMRPTGVYGPGDKDYLVMLQTVKKGLATAVGFKPHYITFVYVKDLARAVMMATESSHPGGIFHVSDGKTYTDREFRDLCVELVNAKALKINVPEFILKIATLIAEPLGRISHKAPTLNSDKYYTLTAVNWKCDISQTIELLGYHPEYELKRGLEETLMWYKEAGWM
ncbi:MAG: NAD-dependent epimerase/dehydratase family protein [Bacteroidales bacterium]